jgi:hypothetical protein
MCLIIYFESISGSELLVLSKKVRIAYPDVYEPGILLVMEMWLRVKRDPSE